MQEPSPHWNSSGRHVSRAEGARQETDAHHYSRKYLYSNTDFTHWAFEKCTVSESQSINNTLARAASLVCSNLPAIAHTQLVAALKQALVEITEDAGVLFNVHGKSPTC